MILLSFLQMERMQREGGGHSSPLKKALADGEAPPVFFSTLPESSESLMIMMFKELESCCKPECASASCGCRQGCFD